MAKFTIGQRAERALKLLLGMRLPRVAQALEPFGFSRATLDEGWLRMCALTDHDFEARAIAPVDVRILKELDEFENTWFPVARAALENHHPPIALQLFARLPQTRGVETVISVGTFLDRLAALEQGLDPFGPEGPRARELLRQRGLGAERVAEARSHLDRLREVGPAAQGWSIDPARQEAAADALWAWYLEWSAIARVAIKNKTLLRALGFSPRRSRSAESGDESLSLVSVSEVRHLAGVPLARRLPSDSRSD